MLFQIQNINFYEKKHLPFQLKDKLQSYELMEINFNDLQTRYDALLQMYGEKVERCEELELDLKECKDAYKIQIQELLSNLKT